MTACARNGLGGRRERGCMRRMTPDARLVGPGRARAAGPGCDGMVHAVGVTARAGARRIVVRRVAGGALRVGPGGDHGAIGVARGARLDLCGLEAMRRVAAGARRMAGGSRGVPDAERSRLLGVAARAALIRGGAGLVDAVAIDAAARAGVPGLLLGVALGAGLGIERR